MTTFAGNAPAGERQLAGIDTPALVVDLSRLQENVTAMAEAMRASGVALRPHLKTSKMVEVARLQLDAGAVGFTCATAAEVEALLDAGIEDVFWANSAATSRKADLAAQSNRRGRVLVGLDSPELAVILDDAGRRHDVSIPCLLEVDTGLRRTGVAPERAERLAAAIADHRHLDLRGVYTHEGQLAGLRGTRDELRAAGRQAAETLVEVAERLRAAGYAIDVVSVGSTPGWDSAPHVSGVTEARPGTYVFFDANQLRLESAVLAQCALTVQATVVSVARPGTAVIDAGLKAMSSDRSNRGDTLGLVLAPCVDSPRRPQTPAGGLLDGVEFTRGYEEHGVLEGPGADRLEVGQRLRILPNHACGVVNMWSAVHVIEDGAVVGRWKPVGRH